MIIKLQSTLFEEIEPAKKRGETIMHGIKSSISAIAVHPHKTKLAIAGADGFILIWDYMRKDDIKPNYQFFNQDKQDKQDFRFFTCMEFTPDGSEILVAVYTGDIKVMDADKGEFKTLNPPLKLSERHSKNYATQMIVTHDGKYFACCDNECSVLLFKKDHLNGDPSKEILWQFTGKIKSHEIGVSSIAFG
jgi:WD40 repeat protein